MIYCSIDIETSGLDPVSNQILSIGAIVEDTSKKLPLDEIPKFHGFIKHHQISGSPTALSMNGDLIQMMSIYNNGDSTIRESFEETYFIKPYDKNDIVLSLYEFLHPYFNEDKSKSSDYRMPITLTVAGKNFGTFDKLFLERLPFWVKLFRVRQRIIDPAILCCDWKNDTNLPSLNQCKERLNISGEVTHNALLDAWDVIQVLRKFY